MRTAVCLVATLLLVAVISSPIAATQAELLRQGKADLQSKDAAQQALGVSCLQSVIQNAPTSAEAGAACDALGFYYKADRPKSLAYFLQAYSIPGKHQSDAGMSVAHTLVAMGRRLDAGAAFEDVGTKFADKADYAYYRGGMCYLGESRGRPEPSTLRGKAKELFGKSVTAGNLEAQLQLLGMRWEDCNSNHDSACWDAVTSDLEAYARDSKSPAYARARAFLMIAEHDLDAGDTAGVLTYTGKVLDPQFNSFHTEQAWALDVRADALVDLNRWDEVVAACDRIYSGFTDGNNFRGNNVRACALDRKTRALKKLGRLDEATAVLTQLCTEYPEYARKAGMIR